MDVQHNLNLSGNKLIICTLAITVFDVFIPVVRCSSISVCISLFDKHTRKALIRVVTNE